jgi:hypothetical protein
MKKILLFVLAFQSYFPLWDLRDYVKPISSHEAVFVEY